MGSGRAVHGERQGEGQSVCIVPAESVFGKSDWRYREQTRGYKNAAPWTFQTCSDDFRGESRLSDDLLRAEFGEQSFVAGDGVHPAEE